MATLHLFVGIPGSGKTTYAKKLATEKGYIVISSDVIRDLHPDWEEEKIFPEVYRLCAEYLENEKDVILDATNITPKVRKRAIDAIKGYLPFFKYDAYFFPIDAKVCFERIVERNKIDGERFLPPEVSFSYGEKIIPPEIEEGFEKVVIIN